MFDDVIDFELVMDAATVGARIATVHEHTFTFPLPPLAIIPTPHRTVRTLVFFHPGM
jgi:hypothetical protein